MTEEATSIVTTEQREADVFYGLSVRKKKKKEEKKKGAIYSNENKNQGNLPL